VRIHVAFTPAEAAPSPVAVVVDLMRATSTIAQALASGWERVYCAPGIEEARALRATLGGGLLGGERDAVQIPGFDLGASPREVREPRGSTLIMSTTNGTRAIVTAAESCDVVLLGSLLNLDAVVSAVRAHGGDVLHGHELARAEHEQHGLVRDLGLESIALERDGADAQRIDESAQRRGSAAALVVDGRGETALLLVGTRAERGQGDDQDEQHDAGKHQRVDATASHAPTCSASARACAASTRSTRACGCGLRRIRPKSIRGSARSSANLVWPLTLEYASGLISDLPTTESSSAIGAPS
jgi:hypothetical protein